MGIYTVTALFQNGSTSSADIPVIINPNPVISLGPDTSICQGTNLILTPGFGFKSYLWSNGNTQWFITITDSGEYWVYVTDFNNCIGYAEKNVVVLPKPPSRLIYH